MVALNIAMAVTVTARSKLSAAPALVAVATTARPSATTTAAAPPTQNEQEGDRTGDYASAAKRKRWGIVLPVPRESGEFW